jgi:hypothetical protein
MVIELGKVVRNLWENADFTKKPLGFNGIHR